MENSRKMSVLTGALVALTIGAGAAYATDDAKSELEQIASLPAGSQGPAVDGAGLRSGPLVVADKDMAETVPKRGIFDQPETRRHESTVPDVGEGRSHETSSWDRSSTGRKIITAATMAGGAGLGTYMLVAGVLAGSITTAVVGAIALVLVGLLVVGFFRKSDPATTFP